MGLKVVPVPSLHVTKRGSLVKVHRQRSFLAPCHVGVHNHHPEEILRSTTTRRSVVSTGRGRWESDEMDGDNSSRGPPVSPSDWEFVAASIRAEQAATHQQQHPEYRQALGAGVASAVRTTPVIGPSNSWRKLRKSCEYCRDRKKRCDGDGVSRCRWAGTDQGVYATISLV